MKFRIKLKTVVAFTFGTIVQLHSQGYIVPNGVNYGGYIPSIGSAIHVLQNPSNGDYTGFNLPPQGANTFSFLPFADEGVRVFLVSSNAPISLQPILSQNYVELGYPPDNYLFEDSIPFYVGLYTSQYSAVNGIYPDPLFGWAQLVNNNGVIELLRGALEYQGGGIYAGTQTIIPIPEPDPISFFALGGLLLGVRRWRASAQ
jgi:hypothetical protein